MQAFFAIKPQACKKTLLGLAVSLAAMGCSQVPIPTQQISPGQQVSEEPPKELASLGEKKTLTPRLIWQQKLGTMPRGYVELHPTITDNQLIAASNNTVSTYNKDTGVLLWSETVPENISGGMNTDAQNVYFGTDGGSAIALDSKSGKTRWVTLLDQPIVAVSTSKEGKVVFRTLSGTIYCLSTENGERLWQRTRKTPVLSLQGASIPILAGPFVVTGFDDGSVVGYELADGKEAWSVKLGAESGLTELSRLIDIDAEMKAIGTALFATSYQGVIAGIDMRSGKAGWRRNFSSYTGIDANETELFATNTEGELWKLQPTTGNPVWSNDDLLRRMPTAPAIMGSSYVLVGDKEGFIHWYNRQKGIIVGRVRGDPAGYDLAPVISANTAYLLGRSGLLSAFSIAEN